MKTLISLLLLNLLIIIHEFGHFLAAKLTKVDVLEFSVGMGPKIFSKKINNTNYSIRLFLIGGYVQLNEENYKDASWLKQIFILLSGALFNFLFALIGAFIYVKLNFKDVSFITTILLSFRLIFMIISLMFTTLFELFKDKTVETLSGPVGIVNGMNTYVEHGFSAVIEGTILLNLNLFIMNLLPLPILDGGKIIFVILKKIFKKINMEKVEEIASIFGLILLGAVFIIAFRNDILNIFVK